jgi:hypothetical protein
MSNKSIRCYSLTEWLTRVGTPARIVGGGDAWQPHWRVRPRQDQTRDAEALWCQGDAEALDQGGKRRQSRLCREDASPGELGHDGVEGNWPIGLLTLPIGFTGGTAR